MIEKWEETQEEIWGETWECPRVGKWDVSFCLTKKEIGADLDVNGSQAGAGRFRISCSDYIPKRESGYITEGNYGFIHNVEVSHPARGKGLGSDLVEYMIKWMKDRGCKGCGGTFKDDQDNEARERFWVRLGFTPVRNKDGKVESIKRSFE